MKHRHLNRSIALACCAIGIAIVLAAHGANAQTTDPALGAPYELWTIQADGTGLHKLVDTPRITCGSPRWSPDGKQIAFDTWTVGKSYDDSKIAIINADGTDLHIIGPGGMPSWSPTGKQLACHTYDNPQAIVVMNVAGTGREKVVDHWGCPRWSPCGNWIGCIDTSRRFMIADLATGKERAGLPAQYQLQIGFSIAPDGRQLCFGDLNGGLYIAKFGEKLEGVSGRQIVKSGVARQCSWSPDGKRIAFASTQGGETLEQIFLVDINSEKAPEKLAGQDLHQSNSCPDWSPDGKMIVFVSQLPRIPIEWVDGNNAPRRDKATR